MKIVYLRAMAIPSTSAGSRIHAPGEGSDRFFIRAGWLIDGSGTRAKKDATLDIREGRIAAIQEVDGRGSPVVDMVDLTAFTVLPVLADAHVHLFMSPTVDPEERAAQLHASYQTMEGVIRGHLRQHLSCGVLALRDGGDYGGFALHYREQELRGTNHPMRVRCAGRAWRAGGRYGVLIGRTPSPGETLGRAIARCKDPWDQVKIVNSGINSLKTFGKETPPQFSPAELKEAAAVCRDLGLPMMVHANGREPVRGAVTAGCDSIEHGFFLGRENLKRMAELGTFWVPTAHTMEAYAHSLDPLGPEAGVAREMLAHQIEQMATAREEGVQVVLGTDCGSLGVHHGAAVKEELRLLMEAGFSVEGAVQCATSKAARLLRLEGEFGHLAVGRPASFLVVRGTPKDLPEALGAIERICVRGTWMPIEG